MADVTKTIGTASRDYTTIAAWEADLDDTGIYNSGDVAIGEMYNDSVFSGAATINGGNTVGLSSTKLIAASGERHDGTAGTGVRSSSGTLNTDATNLDRYVEWLDWAGGALSTAGFVASPINYWRNCLVHSWSASFSSVYLMISNADRPVNATNCILYDIQQTATGSQPCYGAFFTGNNSLNFINCTIHDVTNTGGTGVSQGLVVTDNAGNTLQNCLVTQVDGSSSGSKVCYEPASFSNATCSHNAASDTTASGTGSIDSVTTADQYVSTTGGSEDLHLKSGADAIDAGTDKGTTPSGVEIDIDGRDRDASGDTWDMGADEFVAAAGGRTTYNTDARPLGINAGMSHRMRRS